MVFSGLPNLLLQPPAAIATSLAKAANSVMRIVTPEHHHGGGSRAPAVFLTQRLDGHIVFTGPQREPPSTEPCVWRAGRLPFENALTCPVSSALCSAIPSAYEQVRIAVVVLLVDGIGSVLLTRRAARMRTFPCAWVCPGGSVDPGERPPEAAARELREETGVEVDAASLRALCVWESCFPTSPEACVQAGKIKGHHLIIFFAAQLPSGSERPQVRLQVEESDAATWVPKDHLWAFALEDAGDREDGVLTEVRHVSLEALCGGDPASSTTVPVSLADVAQCYPSLDGRLHGTGEAHMFALREWAAATALEACQGPSARGPSTHSSSRL